jgi:hypothetical protein
MFAGQPFRFAGGNVEYLGLKNYGPIPLTKDANPVAKRPKTAIGGRSTRVSPLFPILPQTWLNEHGCCANTTTHLMGLPLCLRTNSLGHH